jgi:hypothetical protein
MFLCPIPARFKRCGIFPKAMTTLKVGPLFFLFSHEEFTCHMVTHKMMCDVDGKYVFVRPIPDPGPRTVVFTLEQLNLLFILIRVHQW